MVRQERGEFNMRREARALLVLLVDHLSDGYIHFLSFEEAVASALIRGVDVRKMDLSDDATTFAGQVVAETDRLTGMGH
jgi:hypothetical protein